VLSHPARCAAASLAYLDPIDTGFGSMLNSLTKPLMLALDHGIGLWSSPLKAYADGQGAAAAEQKRCATDDMSCFFERLTKWGHFRLVGVVVVFSFISAR
jgi:hypothetical protein